MKILFVGGTFNEKDGKKSSVVEKFAKSISKEKTIKLTVVNGGKYKNLEEILESVKEYDIVFWWANVPDNSLIKFRNVKEINPKAMLVTSKRNDGKYSFSELVNHALMLKSNLVVEFSKSGTGIFSMRIFDPLGNIWYDGADIDTCSKTLLERVIFLKKITRQSTIHVDDTFDEYAEKFDFDNEVMEGFFMVIKKYAEIFHEKIMPAEGVKRFLGNASFRCCKGFPSFRTSKYIYVSQRNVDKRYIDKDHFVKTYLEGNKIYYYGDKKPSVDTPIQLRLYEKLTNINFMVHSHCYVENGVFTDVSLPCGALEEVNEVLKTIEDEYKSFEKDFYIINLIGHGCIVMSSDVDKLKNVKFMSRKLPEIMC